MLSGGPASVYEDGAPKCGKGIFELILIVKRFKYTLKGGVCMKRKVFYIGLTLLILCSFVFFPTEAISLKSSNLKLPPENENPSKLSFKSECVPSPLENWPKVDTNKLAYELAEKNIYGSNLPSSVDLSEFLPPVRSQGAQGSCVCWAVCYYYKTLQEGKAHNWDLTKQAYQFSPSYVYNQINQIDACAGHDCGTNIVDALQVLQNQGCTTLSVSPYDEEIYTGKPSQEGMELAKNFKIKSFSNFFQGLGNCTDETVRTMKQWLANGDAVVFSIQSFNVFSYAPNYPDYVVPPPDPSDKPCANHAILAVGYDDNLFYVDRNNVKHYGAFRLVNSKGTDYGCRGFVNVSYDYMKTAANEAWCMTDVPDPLDFTMGLTPVKQSVMSGNTVNYNLSISSLGGYTGDILISLPEQEEGISITLEKTEVRLQTEENTKIHIKVNENVKPGIYTFAVNATSLEKAHRLVGIIDVKPLSGLLIHLNNLNGEPAKSIVINNWLGNSKIDTTGCTYLSLPANKALNLCIASPDDNIGICEQFSIPGEYFFETDDLYPVKLTARQIDGSILPAYFIFLKNDCLMVFPPLIETVFLSKGIYDVSAYTTKEPYYYLVRNNVEINNALKPQEINFNSSLMEVGILDITFDNQFENVNFGIGKKSTEIWFNMINKIYWESPIQRLRKARIMVTPGSYKIGYVIGIFSEIKPDEPENWLFRFQNENPIEIFNQAITDITLNGKLNCLATVPEIAHPGDDINVKIWLEDDIGSFLSSTWYTYKIGYYVGSKSYQIPLEIVIKDQKSNILFIDSFTDLYKLRYEGISLKIFPEWKNFKIEVAIRLDTGNFQGLVSSSYIISIREACHITVIQSFGGIIVPLGVIQTNYGESKTFTMVPDSGYKIKDVKVDGVSVGAVTTYTFENITMDYTIEATFEPITYTITASAGAGGSISPSGTVTVDYGESKTFEIIPDAGYKVKDVKVDGKSVGTVSTYTFTNITSNHTISAVFEKEITKTIIILKIGSNSFTVNGKMRTLDSPPIIKNSRTLLPIRAVVEALGGTAGWDPVTKKVTVSLGSTAIELWIGKNIAKVNGLDIPIDAANPKVVPEIINSRTMLPLRFIAENLGCTVEWDGTTKTIKITYTIENPESTWPPVVGPEPSYQVAAFYYPWYRTTEVDKYWDHWGEDRFHPPLDIASDFYPALGTYSVANPAVLA